MTELIRVGIIGGAGYTGGELIRLLVNHPHADIIFAHSKSHAGQPVYQAHPDLLGETGLHFSADIRQDIDVLFLCVGHGEARKFLEAHTIERHIRIIDLSQDFRLPQHAQFGDRHFTYGLPELNREKIRHAHQVANPGCFATGIQLALLPMAQQGVLDKVYVTGITGSTGAGQSLSGTSHFSWRANNIQAYKTLSHQHLGEIGASLQQLSPGSHIDINFIPWRGDFTRGIFTSAQLDADMPLEEITAWYEEYYRAHPFTVLSPEPIFLKQAVNTNKCVLQLEKVGSKLVVHSAIDNLLKGASGQAVQNMNLMFGIDERAGLNLKANFF
jgi:N-acetyl-gamma-glutamyl-phosphate reductase